MDTNAFLFFFETEMPPFGRMKLLDLSVHQKIAGAGPDSYSIS
jgi:hypothetical protein